MTLATSVPIGGHTPLAANESWLVSIAQTVNDLLNLLNAATPAGNAGDILAFVSGAASWQGAPKAFAISATNAPALTINAASSWTDLPGCSVSYTVKSASRTVLYAVKFSGYADTAGGGMQIRFVNNGTPIATPAYSFFYNTLAQHQAWTFDYSGSAPAAVGAAVTLKAQVLVVGGGGMRFLMDGNDSGTLVVQELG